MKYKILTKEQIIISLDRLTRFKNTKEKYLRVFSDILITSLIEPKLKKVDIEKLDFSIISEYVSEIFNTSIENHLSLKLTYDNFINKFLKDYENSIFINDDETQKLLNNTINYKQALSLIGNTTKINLNWLVVISEYINNKDIDFDFLREQHYLKYPIQEVLLVEGITEEILLPVFSKYLNYDFYAKGIQIIAAGGKNQVVKKYYELAEQLKIPIFVLLDKDAEDNIKQIKPRLRKNDRIHLVSCGEFEDLLPASLIVKTVNSHFKNFLTITETDLNKEQTRVKVLDEIYKNKGYHEFKKAEFAKLVKENIENVTDISDEIRAIIAEIQSINKYIKS